MHKPVSGGLPRLSALALALALAACGGDGGSGGSGGSTPINADPVAVIAPVSDPYTGTVVQLDASGSLPPDGGSAATLEYLWRFDEKPANSTAELDDSTLAQPRFTADKPGIYRASVIVSQGGKTSDRVEVTFVVAAANTLPEANAGTNQTVERGQRVSLDGRASSDADGDGLQYRWTLTRPTGSQAVLENAHTATPSFVPDFAGSYSASLRVYDGTATATTGVTITVTKPADAPNTKPVAVISAPYGKTFEVERNVPFGLAGTGSYDADGGYIFSASRKWTLISAPDGFDAATNFNKAGIDPIYGSNGVRGTHYGDYVVELQVTDGTDWSDPVRATYTVINGANRPPTASAGLMAAGGAVGIGATVTLSGEGSSDPDNNRLSYAWTLDDRPDGSTATLLGANTVNPTFVADKPGPYTATLKVTDEHGFAAPAASSVTVLAKPRNSTPVLRVSTNLAYSQEQPLVIAKVNKTTYAFPVTEAHEWRWSSLLTSADAYDPDGDTLTYLWAMTKEPAGSRLALPASGGACANTNWTSISSQTLDEWLKEVLAQRIWTIQGENSAVAPCLQLGLAPAVPGSYQFEVAVSDGIAKAGPYRVDLEVVNRESYPSLLLEDTCNGDREEEFWSSWRCLAGVSQQKLFPYESLQGDDRLYVAQEDRISVDRLEATQAIKVYQLTAFDRDYTITNLSAVSPTYPGFQPRFQGLGNGQVIKKGETVTFKLILDIPGEMPKSNKAGEYDGEMGKGLAWKFSIAEKAGWRFHYEPTIQQFPEP